jgi:polyisoprenoid-binding protein YceI
MFSPEESTMSISGTSTIHDWTCDVESVAGWAEIDAGVFASGKVTVQVADIECGKRVMNRKLKAALKGDDNPEISFTATTIAAAGEGWTAEGDLNVAGTVHPIAVAFAASEGNPSKITGEVELSLDDLGVEKPTAVLGTIKTGNLVTVQFEVSAKPAS